MKNVHALFFLIIAAIIFLAGCPFQTEEPESVPPMPPPKSPPKDEPVRDKEPACKDVGAYSDDKNCDGQCKANEKCRPKGSASWWENKIIQKSKPCYACEDVCGTGRYLDDPSCGGSCEEGKKCEDVGEAGYQAGSCYACVSSCETQGLSSSDTCDNKCSENEKCEEVQHPDSLLVSYLVCYKCAPSQPKLETCKKFSEWSEWKWETCGPDGKQEGTRERSCLGEDGVPNLAVAPQVETSERKCDYAAPKVGFIIDGKTKDTFVLGEDNDISVTLDSGGKSMTFPIKMKLDLKLTGKVSSYFLTDGATTQKTPEGYTPVKCKAGNTCTVQTDWGKTIVTEQKTGAAKVDITSFSYDANTEPVSLCTGASCTVNVIFKPKVSLIVDGKPSNTFVLTQNQKLDVVVESTTNLPSPMELALPAYATSTIYVLFTSPTLEGTEKDKVAKEPDTYKAVKCATSNKCTVQTDWGKTIVTEQKTGEAKVDFTSFWNDDNTASVNLCAGASCTFDIRFTPLVTCTENWDCGQWSTCSSGMQTRTCNDLNNCNTNNTKPSLSQSCQACVETWSCGEWTPWSSWSTCSESSTQTRTRTKSCTDANNCGTVTSKPESTQTESQSCTYTPTQQKPEYSSHESSLGSNIENLDYNSASVSRDLSTTGGTFGYRILNIPAKNTITVCVTASGGSVGFFYYPQYHYGFDFTDTTPGCTDIYNKNDWANGVLVHLGDPTPANVNIQLTVTKK